MLKTKLLGVELNNPTILASGVLGVTSASLLKILNQGAGAVTLKSLSLKPRTGHNNPVIITNENWIMNAVGLSNSGINHGIEIINELKKKSPKPVIASIFASSIEEFGLLAQKISKSCPDLVEANISCPNVEDEFGTPFAAEGKAAAKVTKLIKSKLGKIPLSIKLSPNVSNIAFIAKEVEKAGADCITACNTAGPAMCINLETARPILKNKRGGLSGPAIRPIVVRCVYDIYEAVNIPIIATGGITTGKDAIEMIMAGATGIGIGSGVHYRGVDIFKKITKEMEQWMKKNNYKSLDEIRGIAHV